MKPFKNIIFDLGGVLLNLDFSKTTQAFRELGFPHFEEMFSQFKVDSLFRKLETGAINEEEFYTVMLKVGDDSITREQITNAWNSLMLDYRKDTMDFLKVLQQHYKLYLFSNTNSIHYDAFNKTLQKQLGVNLLDEFFTKAYYSHLIGCRKPDSKAFDFVLKDAGINAVETLFIDDTSSNTEAAQSMGMQTHLLLPGEKVEDLPYFRDHLISSYSI